MRPFAVSTLLALVLAAGCSRDDRSAEPIAAEPAGAKAAPARGKVELVAAPEAGELDAVVRAELDRARADKRDLLVYVGAPWCEPCTRFHEAAARGELDDDFPTLRLIEVDLDRDAERLERAGYRSRLIPLFAVPGPDGRASGRQIEGSIKGDGAVRNIAPRLRGLLTGQPAH